ncbi:MAG: hypothetical protein U1F37_18575 [Alphaproteobacteria bacterium]
MAYRSHAAAIAVALAAAAAAHTAAAQNSPLSRGFAPGPAFGGSAPVTSLWYYGPSYGVRYDRAPPGAGQPYRPSLRDDPFYGPDYAERLERGWRFGPPPAPPSRFDPR